jgi:hypothetical protein
MVIANWLAGDREPPQQLRAWFTAYKGGGAGAIDLDCYPDPFVGDLRGIRKSPRLVLLGLNPGIGHQNLQGPDGAWSQRIKKESYSRCFQRSPPEDPIIWKENNGGKGSAYWQKLIRFTKTWLQDDYAGIEDILNFELYPWHSKKLTDTISVPPEIVSRYVIEPLRELGSREVFGFGAPWFRVVDGLPDLFRKIRILEGAELNDNKNANSGWRLGVFDLGADMRFVVSAHKGSAGPRRAELIETMREVVRTM